MNLRIKAFLFRLYTILFGILVGLFIGLIAGTILRIILSSIFHWGDSGPVWVTFLMAIVTILSIIVSTSISIRSVNYYLKRKNLC